MGDEDVAIWDPRMDIFEKPLQKIGFDENGLALHDVFRNQGIVNFIKGVIGKNPKRVACNYEIVENRAIGGSGNCIA